MTDCSSNKEAKIYRKKNTFTYCANTLHSVIIDNITKVILMKQVVIDGLKRDALF